LKLCNNVILLAYSWAADKFKQFLDRVWRLNSFKPVNVYVVLCQGTVDRKLESLTNEKTDAAELVLDGRLIGERLEEVNLAELLKIAKREFNTKDNTIDEALLSAQWPALRAKLTTAMRAWEPEEQSAPALGPAIAIPMARSAQPLVPSVPLAPLATSAPPSQAPCIPAWKLRLFQRAGRLAQLKRADQ
jgi:hypothetical protein